ncbi:hypothetical protein BI330_09015 [Mycobacterium sp. CBMA 623]|nr:hypothetical protein [Mycobacteroides sp. CBMA 326]
MRVYAFNGTVPQWTERYGARYDRIDHRTFGTRDGVVAHQPAPLLGCIVLVPAQQGLVGVAVIPGFDLSDQGTDNCPAAIQMMTTIEPRIP